jgi:hypothetical protein
MVNGIVAHVRTAAAAQGLTLELSGPTFFEVRVLPAAESSILAKDIESTVCAFAQFS